MKIQLRNDTTSNWESYNPILSAGEVGVDITNGKLKVGNGTSTWLELDYIGSVDLSSYATKAEVNAEALARQQADNELQTQLNALPSTYVNFSSSQTITGRKTFSGDIKTDRIYGATTNDTLLRDNNHTVSVGDTSYTSKMIINGSTSVAFNTPSLIQNNNGTTKKILTEADIATTSVPGIVQPDGTTITIDANGVISSQAGGSTYTAGNGIDITNDEISIDSTVVDTSTNQTISGTKTFTGQLRGDLRNSRGNIVILRNGNTIYLGDNSSTDVDIQRNNTHYVNIDSGNISTYLPNTIDGGNA